MYYPSSPGIAIHKIPGASIDYSNITEGYLTVSYVGDPAKKCKLQVQYNYLLQNFAVPIDGTAKVFPLCFSDGDYTIRLIKQIEGSRYGLVTSLNVKVALNSPFAPFLYPNTYSEYNPESLCVKKSAEICAGKTSDIDKIWVMYNWICDNTEYDYELAKRVQIETWWLPDPDRVIREGKCICWGYSSLMAAMCRSQGIPCKIIVGIVKGGGLHAWNEVYSRSGGDIAGIIFKSDVWTRIDVTYMDVYNGKKAAFIMEYTNYTPEYNG